MVKKGIVLGHKVSDWGIEVDHAKIKTIEKLLPPSSIKGIWIFLGHAGFYKRFIKDFSKIIKPLYKLLEKDIPFVFNEKSLLAFQTLKSTLIFALVIMAPDWNLPFEKMCDVSDYVVGFILDKRKDKIFFAIYYANWMLNEA